jgi:uroporphyrinogen III methyltransferase/synthase
MKPPATVIFGEVVALRDKLNWYERLPLFGRRVVITRDRSQSAELADPLHALGADVLELPVIEIQPAADPGPLDDAVARLESYDWLIFTSANGVRFFMERLDASSRDLRAVRARLCAIGPGTRKKLEDLHLKVDRMPEEYVAESLVAAFKEDDLRGVRILLPRAAVARDVVPRELARLGAQVEVVEAYRTAPAAGAAARAREIFGGARKPDWITFTSSSTVKNFVEVAGAAALGGVQIASIGPVTSATIRSIGLSVHAEADPHTMAGLLQAIVRQPKLV